MPKDYSGISIARKVSGEKVELDLIVFQDDKAHAAEVMQKDAVSQHIKYLILFSRGVARSAYDVVLLNAIERLGVAHDQQRQLTSKLVCLAGLVQDRLVERKAV